MKDTWISTRGALPCDGQKVLIFIRLLTFEDIPLRYEFEDQIELAIYVEEDKSFDSDNDIYEVDDILFWQPLIEP